MTAADETKRVALAFVHQWSEPGLGAAHALIADGDVAFLAHAPGAPGGENPGTTFPLLRWLELLAVAIADMPAGLEMRVHRVVAEGDWVAVEAESHSRVRDGRLYNMRYTFWLQVADEKVRELRQYFDTKYGTDFFLDLSQRA